jgi:DNA polymerase (family 10)
MIGKVIQPNEIKGIIHSHSTWSDGSNTIEDMAKAAQGKGFEYLVISDHSQSAYYANGLSPERIAAQHREVDALNEKLAPFKIFKSIEADILSDGSLDYNDTILRTFDLVIASVHSNLKMTQEKAMDRLLNAIRNPYTTILGHPTGRLLLSREGYPIDHKAIIDACAEHKVVVEINAHPRRLDIDWKWIEYAMEKGVLLSIDPDAHTINGYHDVYYGVLAAQKGGLTAAHNLSSHSLTAFEAFLAQYNKKRIFS